ncbi:sulfotransferase [Dactylosporangium sp. AC04546]|uniref:sulfotransferase n=1 Tax=Dactylosporangium sp. AC04546 TaxID=2862460 RepID=UPI001EDE0716|nr:sulfotransferase [Dactylosporangium sp. AC04546]WVK83106.1 sulfotransferase [Dactylosporangium sp. AC04546]
MVRVLFLGGLGRSGTTLLERLLGELPGVCPLGEVVHLWERDIAGDERCGCGKHFSDCEFWRAVGEKAFGGWHHVDVWRVLALQHAVERTRHIPRLASVRMSAAQRLLVEEYADWYARLYEAAAVVSGASVLVDSSKHAALAYCLRYAPSVDLRVVHMVRDSRGVAYSWTKKVSRPETDGAQEMTRYSPSRSALLWNAHNTAFSVLHRCGVPVRRVRYEELLDSPVETLRDIASFADVPFPTAEFVKDGTAELGPCHSAAGNPMRFTVGPVPLRRDDAWRTALPGRQRRVVSALTAPLLGVYGYRGAR